jgi:hypothetical protein
VFLRLCPVYAVGVDDWLTIVLACGLTARLTRLITLDTITQPIRDRLKGLLQVLVECPWCSGFWVALAVGLSWMAWADQTWWQITALIGTLAFLAGALAGAGGPSQHEIAVMGAVPLINADEPMTETVETKVETVVNIPEDLNMEAHIADLIAKGMKRDGLRYPAQDAERDGDGADGSY